MPPFMICGNGLCPCAITLEQDLQSFTGNTCPGREAFDLAFEIGRVTRIATPAADGQRTRIFLARQSQIREHLIGHLFGESTEGCPFAADERINREVQIRPIAADNFDAVIARDLEAAAVAEERGNGRTPEN